MFLGPRIRDIDEYSANFIDQFASGMAAADWSEMVCPTNPRGDGSLDPDCSSSGSATSIAGYQWLDYAIGSDSM